MYRTVADFTFDWRSGSVPGRARYVSPSCARITGYDPGDIQADPDFFARIIHPDDYPDWRKRMDHGAEHGVPSMDFRILRADGAVVWLAQETTGSSVRTANPWACA
jgi:PAS domain S-box-containing protein